MSSLRVKRAMFGKIVGEFRYNPRKLSTMPFNCVTPDEHGKRNGAPISSHM